jgi:hypothetical protein
MTAHDTNLPTPAIPARQEPDGPVTRDSRASHGPDLPVTRDSHGPDRPATRDSRASQRPDLFVTRDSRDSARDKPTVIVWRVSADPVGDNIPARESEAGDSPLTARLARHFIEIYSEVHDTVIDFDADDNLRQAAPATGRRYLAADDPTQPATTSSQPRHATLMVLRWPRQATTTPEQDAQNLLRICKRHLAAAGSTIVIVIAARAGTGPSYREHEQTLLAAAHTAGLRHLHDIVLLDADDDRDTFTYATDHTAADRVTAADTPRQTLDTTLVIFGHPGRRP